MKSLDFKWIAQYVVGIMLLPLPFLPVRQGDGLGLQHLQQPRVRVPEIAEGQHDAVPGSRDACLVILLQSAQINRAKRFEEVPEVLSWHK